MAGEDFPYRIKQLGGWTTEVMPQRYDCATTAERAIASSRRLSAVDRLDAKH